MKTFLWTSFFWVVVIIAGMICLGFGNLLVSPVLDNSRLYSMVPNNIKDRIIAENAVECPSDDTEVAVDSDNLEISTDENSDMSGSSEDILDGGNMDASLLAIINNQNTIYTQLLTSYENLQQSMQAVISSCSSNSTGVTEPEVDPKEQQRLELQAQINALEAQMMSL